MKPGPATSAETTSGSWANAPAIKLGQRARIALASLASTIAAFVARSPWEASRGGSTTTLRRVETGRQRALASAAGR